MQYSKIGAPMTGLGQSRSFDRVGVKSAYTLRAAQEWTFSHFAFGPDCDICTAAKKALLDHLVGGRLTGKIENK